MKCQKKESIVIFLLHYSRSSQSVRTDGLTFINAFYQTTPANDIICQKESSMYNYPEQVKSFLEQSFKAFEKDVCNVKMTNEELLFFLFQSFPKNCISDYELNEIMQKIGFVRDVYFFEKDDLKELRTGWFLFSEIIQKQATQ